MSKGFSSVFISLLVSLSLWAQNPQVAITLTPGDTMVASASYTLAGSVDPISATLTMGGTAITVDGNGDFSHAVTLHSGLNTFLLRASADGYDDGVVKRDVYLDNVAPILRFTSPEGGAKVNTDDVKIYGRVDDAIDDNPILQRDIDGTWTDVPLDAGRFVDEISGLNDGNNTFSYKVIDAAGNEDSSYTITIDRNIVPPHIDLTVPVAVARNGTFDLSMSFTPPEHISSVTLIVDGGLVYEASDGTALVDETYTHGGSGQEIAVVATARDAYGNETIERRTIAVGDHHYIHGRVLVDGDSAPLSNIAVNITTPLASYPLVTDAQGQYRAYVQGLPATVTISDNHI